MKTKISSLLTLSLSLLLAISTARVAPAAPTVKTITETQKLTDSDGEATYGFGESVSISGDLAIVGFPDDTILGFSSGSASIFAFDGANWNFQAKLTGSDEVAFDSFGASVAITENMALIGAPGDDTLSSDRGAVYVFVFDGTNWTEQAKLYFAGGAKAGSRFGGHIALSGNTAAISASGYDDIGAVFIFTFDGTAWTEQARITPSDGTVGDVFGSGVAISGDRVLIADYFKDSYTGTAYIFGFDGTTWTQEAELRGLDTRLGDRFGSSVALSGDLALIGAPNKNTCRGAAYIFAFDGTSWSQQTKLKVSGAQVYDEFGSSVALSDTVAIVGAKQFLDSGKIYQYSLRRGVWKLRAELVASDSVGGNSLGTSVALSGNTVLGGADMSFTNEPGAAYVFKIGR